MKQKIWLYIFPGMFLVPEILWSPIGNFLYSFFMPTIGGSSQVWRDNFLLSSDANLLYTTVLFIQIVGAVAFTTTWIMVRKNIKSKLIYWSILISSGLLSLLAFCTGLLVFVFRNCCDIL